MARTTPSDPTSGPALGSAPGPSVGPGPDPALGTPTVLVVLVTHDAAAWIADCLRSLAVQTYPRLGVLAVDNASSDGTRATLEQSLGAGRVLALGDNRGVAGAVQAALARAPAAAEADYLLITHDDTAMDPDCVTRLVGAAIGIQGLERVGVVGPKVVDWFEPRLLREVGRSTDRFGHPYTPLEDGEIDQGQFDRVLEVMYVSSCAMLVSRECLHRTGVPDERFASHHEDLDFCWRARVAGYRVLMTPLGRARHMAASTRGDRPDEHRPRSSRYYGERASLAAMLKNYGLLSLLALLPLSAVTGLTRLVGLALTRRFDDAWDMLTAWGWNVAHLPGTIRRRVRAQSVRSVKDHSIRRFMEASGFGVPKWVEAAGEILAEQRGLGREDDDEAPRVRLRHQTVSLARAHPALLGSVVAAVLCSIAFRDLFGAETVRGAVVPSFPTEPSGLFAAFVSGIRTTGLGGAGAGSPALAAMGGLSWLLLGSTRLAQKVILAGLPVLAGVTMYRAVTRQTRDRLAAVVAAISYALSGAVLWAFSDGRIAILVALAALPALADRIESAFDTAPPARSRRFVVGLGVAIAVGVSFFPGVALSLLVLVAVRVVAAPARLRGVGLALAGAVIGTLLMLPFLPTLVAGGGAAFTSSIGTLEVHRIGRLAIGPGPGTGVAAWFLPLAALFGLSLAGGDLRGRALRATLGAVAGLGLAWASADGLLPAALSDQVAYVALAATCEAMLVGYGVAALAGGVGRDAFGWRQVGAAALTIVLGAGLAMQSVEVMVGGWAWGGPDAIPAGWAVVADRSEGDFRVLWLGDDLGLAFPAPGGDPQGILDAGAASVRFNVTDRDGLTILDTGRPLIGTSTASLRIALRQLVSGGTRHGGALLGSFGIRFVVAGEGDLPPSVSSALGRQLDLDAIPTDGLTIFRNERALPPAGVSTDPDTRAIAASSSPEAAEQLQDPSIMPTPFVPGAWDAQLPAEGTLLVSSERVSGLRATGDAGATLPVGTSFGWATRVDAPAGSVHLRYADQWAWTASVWVAAVLWGLALWITRRPGSSR
jgi:GT2 family glycosyltransferase